MRYRRGVILMRISNRKRNYLLLGTLIFVPFSLLQVSCSSNIILTENLELMLPEQKQMLSSIKRNDDDFYLSNLKNYTPPKESQLINEAKFRNLKQYNDSARVLSDWVLKNLSQKEKNQMSRNCDALVGGFKNQFPLNEQTLACAAWWLEKKNNDEIAAAKLQPFIPILTRNLTNKQKRDWQNYKGMSFMDAFSQLDPQSFTQARNMASQAIEYASDCSFSGAGSALILRLESFLPNKEVYPSIEKIYSRMQKCLLPDADPSEKIHLRVGLLRLISGYPSLAKESLEKALLDKDPSESSRSLFWLGVIYQKNKSLNSKDNPYWQRLIKENSISLAAILASQQMGIDPFNNLVPDEEVLIQARESSEWNDNNLEAFIFDLFRARKDMPAATEWSNFVGRTTSVTNPNFILYWALAQNSVYNYRYSIFMLGRYGKYVKNYPVSRTMLNLHFPKPYLKEISEYSDDVDPIFVLSLVRQESAFDPSARSSANARGLMQILPTTAKSIKRKLSSNQLYDPETNLEVGIAYLNRLLKRYDGRIEYVLAAYNAGASNLDKWRDRVINDNMMLFCDFMPFKETRSYVSLILRNYYWYSRIISEKEDLFAKKIQQQSAKARWKSDRVAALLSFIWKSDFEPKQKALLDRIYIFGDKTSNITSINPDWINLDPPKNKSYENLRDEIQSEEKTAFSVQKDKK
jgi:soluble lytic murein transglycosylase